MDETGATAAKAPGATSEASEAASQNAIVVTAPAADAEEGGAPTPGGPATEVVMPQMGESIFEGTITKWLKKVGEEVTRDEPLFEISTTRWTLIPRCSQHGQIA